MRNIESQRRIAQDNAQIYYENKGESLKNSYGMLFENLKDQNERNEGNKDVRSYEGYGQKPPKYPSPQSDGN